MRGAKAPDSAALHPGYGARYNAGPCAVQKYGGVPPYDETRVYVERVATLRDRYQQAL